ncbi:MAG: phosphatase PAP2 family protein [Desulfuromonadales bacterium]
MQGHRQSFFILFLFLVTSLASPPGTVAADTTEQAGDIAAALLAATAVGATAVNHDGEGFLQYGKSVLLSTGATAVLKYSVEEERPNGEDRSFPSLHTSFSFAAAEYLRKRYGWEYGLPAYAAASFVGYSRVESDNHYWHDVLAGAAIGIASSYLFTESYHGVRISGSAGKNYVAMQLSRSW